LIAPLFFLKTDRPFSLFRVRAFFFFFGQICSSADHFELLNRTSFGREFSSSFVFLFFVPGVVCGRPVERRNSPLFSLSTSRPGLYFKLGRPFLDFLPVLAVFTFPPRANPSSFGFSLFYRPLLIFRLLTSPLAHGTHPPRGGFLGFATFFPSVARSPWSVRFVYFFCEILFPPPPFFSLSHSRSTGIARGASFSRPISPTRFSASLFQSLAPPFRQRRRFVTSFFSKGFFPRDRRPGSSFPGGGFSFNLLSVFRLPIPFDVPIPGF